MSPEFGVGSPVGFDLRLAGATAAEDREQVAKGGEIGIDEEAFAGGPDG